MSTILSSKLPVWKNLNIIFFTCAYWVMILTYIGYVLRGGRVRKLFLLNTYRAEWFTRSINFQIIRYLCTGKNIKRFGHILNSPSQFEQNGCIHRRCFDKRIIITFAVTLSIYLFVIYKLEINKTTRQICVCIKLFVLYYLSW